MKKTLRFCFAALAFALLCPIAGQSQVVPTDRATQFANGTFLGPLANAPRTYQLLIHANQLTDLVGQQLNGLSWRLPSSTTAAWPTADVSITSYDIYLSGSVDPANRSLTFADNVVGPQTQVRSGPLNITANSYGFGDPSIFGPTISFDSYQYNGGNLLVELRHTGFSGASRSVDAMLASGGMGYGVNFSAAWTGSYTGTSGAQGNFGVIKLSVVPEPAGMLALAAGIALLAYRRLLVA